jgi:hypothetical protein
MHMSFRSGARLLLLHLRYAPFAYSHAVDLAISWLIQSRRLKSYSVIPSVVGPKRMLLYSEIVIEVNIQ